MGKKVKPYDVKMAYLGIADNISNFGMAKAFLNSHAVKCRPAGYYATIESILGQKYKKPFARKLIHLALADVKQNNGKSLSIPKLGIKEVVLSDLLKKFVDDNFYEMYKDYKLYVGVEGNPYPIALTNSVRKVEQSVSKA